MCGSREMTLVEWVERLPEGHKARQQLDGVRSVIADSKGVAGYHLNGDVATWDELFSEDTACLLPND